MKNLFGLPEEVIYCNRCVMSNQRPTSYPEFRHTRNRITPTIHIDEEGICDACKYGDQKREINWDEREKELDSLLDKYRKTNGDYDCIVPGSGGKDSAYTAHLLKYKYGMNPLTVTWSPTMYTDYGRENFENWINVGGFDNITWNPNGRAHQLLTRLAVRNLLHPFQTFILGQKNVAPKIAARFGISLLFYGEPEAEYGNPIAETHSSLRDHSYYVARDLDNCFIGGVSVSELVERYKLALSDISSYLPLDYRVFEASNLQVHYMGYYVKWTPQEAYYYSVENTGFKARPFRSEGTYSKYASIDDKMDDLHFYTTHIKFGLGRASHDASQEIRNNHITRDEGIALVRRFDGEFPTRYFDELMEYLGMSRDEFISLCDENRSGHLWTKEASEWKLRSPIQPSV